MAQNDQSSSKNVNEEGHYNIKRREFGHGQSGAMVPRNDVDYGPGNSYLGRDYETNVGYRESYKTLDLEESKNRKSEENRKAEHRGKGPRSYRRSDERIVEDIHIRLTDDPYLDASHIEVKVVNGEVTLTGTVEDRPSKRRAEDLAEDVSGVNHLENRLRIKKMAW